MLIKATLSNARHPEYGEVTIPFPIKTSEYDHRVDFLSKLWYWLCSQEIGGEKYEKIRNNRTSL